MLAPSPFSMFGEIFTLGINYPMFYYLIQINEMSINRESTQTSELIKQTASTRFIA